METSESFLDSSTSHICGTFWRDATRCPIGRNRMHNGGHVCAEPSGHPSPGGHACKCGHAWSVK